MNGIIIGKLAVVFISGATQNGGQKTTIISTILSGLYHILVLIGLSYSFQD